MKILALAGKRKTGKTTASNIVVEIGDSMGLKIKKLSFGFVLKQMYARHYGVKLDDLFDEFEKEKHRKQIIIYANWVKSHSPKYFIDQLWGATFETDNVIIDDLRTIEELQSVVERAGNPYKMEVDKFVREMRGAKYNPEVDNDISEIELGDLSSETFRALGGGYIFNNKTKDHLREELIPIVKQIFLPKVGE